MAVYFIPAAKKMTEQTGTHKVTHFDRVKKVGQMMP